MVRNHLCLHHRYPIGFALFLLLRAPGYMLGGGARVQNLGHICVKVLVKISLVAVFQLGWDGTGRKSVFVFHLFFFAL